MKTCITCKWCQPPMLDHDGNPLLSVQRFSKCGNPACVKFEEDPVTGEKWSENNYCEGQREDPLIWSLFSGACGYRGRFWEASK